MEFILYSEGCLLIWQQSKVSQITVGTILPNKEKPYHAAWQAGVSESQDTTE